MTSETDIDGRIGQGWGGVSPNGAHVNVVLGRRGSPTAAALMTTFTAPSPGHTPVLVCVGADQPSYEAVMPPTIMMNKATTTTERHQTMTFGAGQLGIGQGVLDAVADGLLSGDQDTVVFVAIWIDEAAADETALRTAARDATRAGVQDAAGGPMRAAVDRLVAERDALRNPFYGGE
jgi:formaldehyde-activating enzyme